MEPWVAEMFHFKVEKMEIKRPGGKPYFPVQNSGIGVLHMTEGSTVSGAFRTLAAKNVAPHFIVGEERIIQCRPIGMHGSALRGNSPNPNQQAQTQIEMVGFSQKTLWLPEASRLKPTVAVMAWCFQQLGIPLQFPNHWPDDLSDLTLPFAANNLRHRAAVAGL